MSILGVVASCCSVVVGVYGLIYRHVSSIHRKIDTIATHVAAHDTADAAIQTRLDERIGALSERVRKLEESVA